MTKITAIIPTLNEEIHISNAIKSVSFADEIIVIDSYSLDKTIEHINNITLSDLAIVANKLKLDTTYLLRGDEHEKN